LKAFLYILKAFSEKHCWGDIQKRGKAYFSAHSKLYTKVYLTIWSM